MITRKTLESFGTCADKVEQLAREAGLQVEAKKLRIAQSGDILVRKNDYSIRAEVRRFYSTDASKWVRIIIFDDRSIMDANLFSYAHYVFEDTYEQVGGIIDATA